MIVTIIGARPQFVKAAVLSKALADAGIAEMLIHTGQHYDYKMSEVFFEELNIPGVTHNLNVGSSLHGAQTAEMMIAIEQILIQQKEQVKAVLVYGDTNSTIAGALVAAKLHIPIIHVEAGLRSFDKRMPEEVNRIVTDHLSHTLFCSSQVGVDQLATEGITQNVFNVGDIMYDAVATFVPKARKPEDEVLAAKMEQPFNLVTIHRPSNTDDEQQLQRILDAIGEQSQAQFIWPVHPRNKQKLNSLQLPKNLTICEPISYFEMMYALAHCTKVITDSGGLQKEAYWLKKPVITMRNTTEWVETLHNNWNQLCDFEKTDFKICFEQTPSIESWQPLYGNGSAAIEIVNKIGKLF